MSRLIFKIWSNNRTVKKSFVCVSEIASVINKCKLNFNYKI